MGVVGMRGLEPGTWLRTKQWGVFRPLALVTSSFLG